MNSAYFRMDCRSSHHPVAWPLVYWLGVELASVSPALDMVRTDTGEIGWNEREVREALENALGRFAESRRNHPSLSMYPLIFSSRNGIKLDFTLAWDELVSRVKAVTAVFQEEHVRGADSLSVDEIASVFEKIVAQTGSICGEFGQPPPISEEWYYEAGRKTDVERVPTSVEWMTYFGPELVERIGEKKFHRVPEGEIREIGGGILFILQREPFSYEEPDHRARQRRLNKYLEIDRIHKLYPRRTERPARKGTAAVKPREVRIPIEEVQTRAQLMVELAQRLSGERLDYSTQSLARVDEIVEGFRREGTSLEKVSQTLLSFGCYVGEVVVRNASGAWQVADERALQWAACSPVVRLGDGLVINPIGKVIKRFENGEVDSLMYFYKALIENRGK